MTADPVVVEARRTRCPVPVLRAARVARGLEAGAEILVLADDPATAVDLPAWARMRGHSVVAVEVTEGGEHGEQEVRVLVRLGG